MIVTLTEKSEIRTLLSGMDSGLNVKIVNVSTKVEFYVIVAKADYHLNDHFICTSHDGLKDFRAYVYDIVSVSYDTDLKKVTSISFKQITTRHSKKALDIESAEITAALNLLPKPVGRYIRSAVEDRASGQDERNSYTKEMINEFIPLLKELGVKW